MKSIRFMNYLPKNLAEGLLYSDPNFIALVYEESTRNSPETQISNDSGVNAKLNLGIGSFGGSTKEIRTFKVSSFGMINSIRSHLELFPEFSQSSFTNSQIPQTCWLRGRLCSGEWRGENGSEVSDSKVFEIMVGKTRHTLVAQRDLFSGGLGFLNEMESALTIGMNVPVNALVRVTFHNRTLETYITSPLLIVHAEDTEGHIDPVE